MEPETGVMYFEGTRRGHMPINEGDFQKMEKAKKWILP